AYMFRAEKAKGKIQEKNKYFFLSFFLVRLVVNFLWKWKRMWRREEGVIADERIMVGIVLYIYKEKHNMLSSTALFIGIKTRGRCILQPYIPNWQAVNNVRFVCVLNIYSIAVCWTQDFNILIFNGVQYGQKHMLDIRKDKIKYIYFLRNLLDFLTVTDITGIDRL
ncbi:hypothetical protein ACJX0J_011092, partial [Zea mays]